MRLNDKANWIRNQSFSDDQKMNFEIKKDMINLLKMKLKYEKDIESAQAKRERWGKIQEGAQDDREKMRFLREELYTAEEKREQTLGNFFYHKGYAKLWDKLDLDGKRILKERFKVTNEGDIEILGNKRRKLSILQAEHTGKYVFDGSYKDQYGRAGIEGVNYLTGKSAEIECRRQGKKLLNNRKDVEHFIDQFPGNNVIEKIYNFVQFFELEFSGTRDIYKNQWVDVDEVGYMRLSKVDGENNVWGVRWDKNNRANIVRNYQGYPCPFVVFENLRNYDPKRLELPIKDMDEVIDYIKHHSPEVYKNLNITEKKKIALSITDVEHVAECLNSTVADLDDHLHIDQRDDDDGSDVPE